MAKTLLCWLTVALFLGAGPPVHASEIAHAIFGDLTESLSELASARLEITETRALDSIAYSTTTSEGICVVSVHPELIAQAYAEELAIVFGHELAHCLLKHHHALDPNRYEDQVLAWADEYEADALGLALAAVADYATQDAQDAYETFLRGDPGDTLHPPGSARIQALKGGSRVYPPAPPAPSPRLTRMPTQGSFLPVIPEGHVEEEERCSPCRPPAAVRGVSRHRP